MTLRMVLAGAGMMALAACTVGPNYRPPEASVPAAFVEAQAAAGQGAGPSVDPASWWRAFGDPTLDMLVTRALADNPDMGIAASRVRQARLEEIAAGAVGKPVVNASANASHIEFSRNAGFSQLARAFSGGGDAGGTGTTTGIALPGSGITTFAAGFDSSWELDLFGGGRRQVEAARARTDAAEWSRRDAAVTLAAEVAQAYFALRFDQAQVGIVEAELANQRRAQTIAGNIAKVGLVPQIDVTRQRGRITTTEARLEPIRADARVRMHALAILVGGAPDALADALTTPLAVLPPAPTIPAGLPSDLLRRRPDIRAAERRLAASTADIGVAVADLYPKFSLTGIAQLISTSLASLLERDSLQLTGSGAVSFPLLDWGRRKASVESRKEASEQAYLDYRRTVLGALRDVEDPLAQIDAERRRRAALERALADAVSSAKATEAQYRTGFVAQDSLLTAQTDVLTAREQVAASDAQVRQMTVALFKAIGGGWSEDMAVPARPMR